MNGNEYTAKQAKRYAQITNQAVKEDCLWRIASNLDLLPGLNPDGTLTEDEAAEIAAWVENTYGV